ncbi:hypothetical protein BIW11_02088 [Tropilaelaps mercedesae]|uniref:Uncharacterized protein n=1 Tax=Tropilaelaps mercedesae TaxID=418985 RepID=A0A1V9X3G9_9ACAR|nr:hypothetical protein BIW11_02088 [Tropilaelaps mercedesae]
MLTFRCSLLVHLLIFTVISAFWVCAQPVDAAQPISPCTAVKCVVGRCFLEKVASGDSLRPVCKNLPPECVCGGLCYITKKLDQKSRCPECVCP